MVTVPEANRLLWEALEIIYAAQREAAARSRNAIASLAEAHPEVDHDSLARDALQAAVARQDGMTRFADSQVALAETMRTYWEQRSGPISRNDEPVPLLRRSAPATPSPNSATPGPVRTVSAVPTRD